MNTKVSVTRTQPKALKLSWKQMVRKPGVYAKVNVGGTPETDETSLFVVLHDSYKKPSVLYVTNPVNGSGKVEAADEDWNTGYWFTPTNAQLNLSLSNSND
jgi:hypothetical protein